MQRPWGRKEPIMLAQSGGLKPIKLLLYRWGKAGVNSEMGTVYLSLLPAQITTLLVSAKKMSVSLFVSD